jgi:tripartite-type tricarboxylate transporter receptor subunit TctC
MVRAFMSSLIALAYLSLPAAADPVADFYHGKQVSMIVPSGAGGGYDLYTRFLARFMGKYIPGTPAMIVKNLPGAGGITAANAMAATVVPDGLTIAMFQNTVTLNQLTKSSSVKFDVRQFEWIGNMSIASTICALSGSARDWTAKDLLNREVVIGATFGSPSMIPAVLNNLAGTKFKIVQGYVSTSNVQIAMEAGEVSGLCGWSWDGARVNGREMFAKGVAKPVIDIAIQPQPELQKMGVPFLMDSLPEGDKKEALKIILSTQVYNRPFAAPPNTPKDRVAALRKAFAQTLEDQELKEEAEKLGLDVEYLAPERILDLIKLALDAPPHIQDIAVNELNRAGF